MSLARRAWIEIACIHHAAAPPLRCRLRVERGLKYPDIEDTYENNGCRLRVERGLKSIINGIKALPSRCRLRVERGLKF